MGGRTGIPAPQLGLLHTLAPGRVVSSPQNPFREAAGPGCGAAPGHSRALPARALTQTRMPKADPRPWLVEFSRTIRRRGWGKEAKKVIFLGPRTFWDSILMSSCTL